MTKANPATLRIRWIRSGIAFNRKQKEIIRSLGLRRLHHVVERPDNSVVRGLIAKVAHLVEVVGVETPAARTLGPEYVIVPAGVPEAVAEERVAQIPEVKARDGDTAGAGVASESDPGAKAARAESRAEESESEAEAS